MPRRRHLPRLAVWSLRTPIPTTARSYRPRRWPARATVKGPLSRAASDLTKVSLLGGEITADAVVARSAATLDDGTASGGFGSTGLTNLVVLGEPVEPSPNLRVQLGDWGHVVLLEEQISRPRLTA